MGSYKENRELAWKQYKQKWGLEKYRFFADYKLVSVIENPNEVYDKYLLPHEIKSVDALIKKKDFIFVVRIPLSNYNHPAYNHINYSSLSDFVETKLIEKLAGLNES